MVDRQREREIYQQESPRLLTLFSFRSEETGADTTRTSQKGLLFPDKSTLKVYLPNGGFNVVKFGDATDIKVGMLKCTGRDVYVLLFRELYSF